MDANVSRHVKPQVYSFSQWEVDCARRELRADGAAVPIGSRAFDIIETLLKNSGAVVGKRELMTCVWPDVVVEENTLRVHIASIRRAFGKDREMLSTAAGRGYRLLGDWRALQVVDVGPADAGSKRTNPNGPSSSNIPAPVTKLIGRSSAIDQVRDLLSAHRMVTLTGPGGIGKTVLAVEVARSLVDSFEGKVWLVELSSIIDAGLVPSAVASAIGLKLAADTSAEATARGIGDERVLILLDNCEHLIEAVAELAEIALQICANTTILATSRELLKVAGEHVYKVQPLEVPGEGLEESGSLRNYSSVQLFTARAQASNSEFVAEEDEIHRIGTICRQLDGLPLAIEFAAARAAILGTAWVAEDLDDRLTFLISGRRTALPRHKTLRAVLDWSYDLLSEFEQRLLRHLALFAGGFTLEAASALVCEDAPKMLEGLLDLVSKSLVAIDNSAPAGRWRLLETIRVYATEKLVQQGELEHAGRRHAEYFKDLLARSPSTPDQMNSFERELHNFRAAIDWCFSPAGNKTSGIVATSDFVKVLFHLRFMVECLERTQRALEQLDVVSGVDPQNITRLNLALGTTSIFTMSTTSQSRGAFQKALHLARTLGDSESEVMALWGLWILNLNTGECRLALEYSYQFESAAKRIGDRSLNVINHRLVGSSLHFNGRQREAQHHCEHLLSSYEEPTNHQMLAWLHHYDQRVVTQALLARILAIRGRIDQSLEHTQAARKASLGKRPSIYEVLRLASVPIAFILGDLNAAEEATGLLGRLASQNNAPFWVKVAERFDAALLIEQGDAEEGVRRLYHALNSGAHSGWTVWEPEFRGSIGKGLASLGRFSEALQVIDVGLQVAARGGETYYEPELLRLKGELLIQVGGASGRSDGENCLRVALRLAEEQDALLWRLRIAVSLLKSLPDREQRDFAKGILMPIYSQFTEGLSTSELISVRTLLKGLE
jgi:predicted ATPase/DNA-binding winged helix-turn-helix (wHTH) protein